jgi:DNA polymerase I-like protein with 3'-5' exonuclease and polymerase domains
MGRIVAPDFLQIELRVLAHLSEQEQKDLLEKGAVNGPKGHTAAE